MKNITFPVMWIKNRKGSKTEEVEVVGFRLRAGIKNCVALMGCLWCEWIHLKVIPFILRSCSTNDHNLCGSKLRKLVLSQF